MEEGYRLLGDAPCTEADRDALGFDEIAQSIAQLIASSRNASPFVFGIEGGWGEGKSSLMQMVQRHLASREDIEVSTVLYNAWTADEDEVLEGLIKSVLDALDENILRRVAKNRRVFSVARVASTAAASAVGLGRAADEIWSHLHVDPEARNEMRSLMVEAMREWRDKKPELAEDRLLVVFVDDLDRCSPEAVIRVFEAMKLYLDAPGIVFVVGFDSTVISRAVGATAPGAADGSQYIEKVVQVRYRLPPPSTTHGDELLAAYLEESLTQDLFDDSAKRLLLDRNHRNPRRIKRFINRFVVEYGLTGRWMEVGAEALVRVLLIYEYFPDFARQFLDLRAPDPISQFLDYLVVYRLLELPETDSDGDAVLADVVDRYGIPADTGLLEALATKMPRDYSELVHDSDFVSLVEGLAAKGKPGAVRKILEERGQALISPTEAGATPQSGPSREGMTGARVLWIGERVRDANEAMRFSEQGAEINFVTGFADARTELEDGFFPHIIVATGDWDEDALARSGIVADLRQIWGGDIVILARALTDAPDSKDGVHITNDLQSFRTVAGGNALFAAVRERLGESQDHRP